MGQTQMNLALNRIAKEMGYVSWGLLMRDYEPLDPKPTAIPKNGYQIKTLPVAAEYRKDAIDLANNTFEMVMRRIEPDNPEETLAPWDAAEYIDHRHLNADVLPIDNEYALSLIEAFLVYHVVDLAVQADRMATKCNWVIFWWRSRFPPMSGSRGRTAA